MLSQKGFVNPRMIVESFQIPSGDQLEKIFVPSSVSGKKGKMIGSLPSRRNLAVKAALQGHIDFTTQKRFHPVLLRGVIEFDSPKHIAVISQSNRRHPPLFCAGEQSINAVCTIKKAIFGVYMEMHKIRVRHWELLPALQMVNE
jgi:hypothetical protein